jgi:hypothetical protein
MRAKTPNFLRFTQIPQLQWQNAQKIILNSGKFVQLAQTAIKM